MRETTPTSFMCHSPVIHLPKLLGCFDFGLATWSAESSSFNAQIIFEHRFLLQYHASKIISTNRGVLPTQCVCMCACVCGVPICGLIGKLLPLMWQNHSCSDCLNESSISTGKGLGHLGHPGNDPRHFGVQGPHPIPNLQRSVGREVSRLSSYWVRATPDALTASWKMRPLRPGGSAIFTNRVSIDMLI